MKKITNLFQLHGIENEKYFIVNDANHYGYVNVYEKTNGKKIKNGLTYVTCFSKISFHKDNIKANNEDLKKLGFNIELMADPTI